MIGTGMYREAKSPGLAGLLLLWGLSGCATTTVVRPGEAFHLPGSAVAVTRDGRNLEFASALRVGDCLYLDRGSPDQRTVLPLGAVKEVIVRDPGLSALRGLIYGPLAGASAGFLLGLTPAGNCKPGTAGACIFGGPGGMAFLGGLIGLIYGPIHGAVAGRNQVYVFAPAASAGDACPGGGEGVDSIPEPEGDPGRGRSGKRDTGPASRFPDGKDQGMLADLTSQLLFVQ